MTMRAFAMKYAIAFGLLISTAACGGLPYVGGPPFEEGAGDDGGSVRDAASELHFGFGSGDGWAIDGASADAGDPPPELDGSGGPEVEASAPPPVDAAAGDERPEACAAMFSRDQCAGYTLGTRVSDHGRNWGCANVNCANCATTFSCDPGENGCPWGNVWTDEGPCQ